MRGSENSARGTRARQVAWGRRERPGQSVCVRNGKAQSAGFAAGRAVLGKDRLLAGFKVNMSAGRGGAAAQLAMAAAFVAAWLVPNSTKSAVANGDTRTITPVGPAHQRIRLVHVHGQRRLRPGGARQAELVLPRLAAQRADQDGPAPVRHHLGGLPRIGVDAADRRSVRLPLAADQRDAAPALAAGGRAFAAHGRQGDRRPFPRRRHRRASATSPCACRTAASASTRPASTPWVHIDSGSVRYWPRMSRDALTRLFPDGKTVFIPADGQPMPGYEQARAEIEARGGQVQMASGGFGDLLLAVRPRRRRGRRRGGGRAGSDDRHARRPATREAAAAAAPQPPQVEVADAGPEAVAKAKRNLPTGPAYADPSSRRPRRQAAASRYRARRRSPGPSATCRPARPTPAPRSRPTPPVKPQVVAALEQPDVASDASRDGQAPSASKSFGPLPPRRPADLDIAPRSPALRCPRRVRRN